MCIPNIERGREGEGERERETEREKWRRERLRERERERKTGHTREWEGETWGACMQNNAY